MKTCTIQELKSYLDEYGWSYQQGDGRSLQTGFQGQDRSFPLQIQLTETWVSFTIEPYLDLDIDWESWPEISRCLLELNSCSSMVRLGIQEKGLIELSLDLLVQNFNYEGFVIAVGLLGFYADHFYDEILSRLDGLGFRYSESLRLLT